MSDNCLFCKIIRGELRSQNVFEDELCLAFKDINPAAPTHLLVVPKKHISALSQADEQDKELLGHLQIVIQKVAKEARVETAFRVVNNNGRGAGQSVDHLHYHILAGRRLAWPPG